MLTTLPKKALMQELEQMNSLKSKR
jgi:hypothetical protein